MKMPIKSIKMEAIHKFRNTLVRLKILEDGKPCGRFYHRLKKRLLQ